jgi:hypothetical protein
MKDLIEIYGVDRDKLSRWLNRYEKARYKGGIRQRKIRSSNRIRKRGAKKNMIMGKRMGSNH